MGFAMNAEVLENKDQESHFNYYGWVIVAISLINILVFYGIWYSYSVFLVALIREFGWDHTKASSVFTVFMVFISISGPVIGYLIDRLGPRIVLSIGASILSVGLVLCSQAKSILDLYWSFGIIVALGGNTLGLVGNAGALASWFTIKRGRAIGIVTSGMGLSLLVFVPVVQILEPEYGWRHTFLVLSAISALLIPLNAIFQRRRGNITQISARRHPGEPFWKNSEFVSILNTSSFLHLLFVFFSAGLIVQAVLMHQVAIAYDAQFEQKIMASAFVLLGFCGVMGRPIWGVISDRVGRKRAYLFASIIFSMGLSSIYLAKVSQSVWLLYGYSLFFGLGYSAFAPLNWTLAADNYGGRYYSSIYGILYMGTGFGAALGPLFSGFIYDHYAGYGPVYIVVIIFLILSNSALHRINL
jgi:MFS family permease